MVDYKESGVKQLVVLSGKGGTGKTTVAAALAHLASSELSIVLADVDVDAANLELVLDPVRQEEQDFRGGKLAVIDSEACTACGTCAEVCRFEAVLAPATQPGTQAETQSEKGAVGYTRRTDGPILNGRSFRIDDLACEGCAACYFQCPEDAIHMEEQRDGQWFRSNTRFGPLFHAHLFAGQENSGKLVTLVKQQARRWAQEAAAALVLVDGPPGIGCPVISACSGMDLALHVVEPTVSGAHDLERVMGTTDHFDVPSLVLINKADLNLTRSKEIASFCAQRGVELVGHVPYDTVVTEAMVEGHPVTEYVDGPVTEALKGVWKRIKTRILGE